MQPAILPQIMPEQNLALLNAPITQRCLRPSFLAGFIQARLDQDSLPARGRWIANPGLKALKVYVNRSAVESFPLIYTTLALASPN